MLLFTGPPPLLFRNPIVGQAPAILSGSSKTKQIRSLADRASRSAKFSRSAQQWNHTLVDPSNLIPETPESDNVLKTRSRYEIKNCP
jgi:hypothetical protein